MKITNIIPKVFLDECLHKIEKCYIMIELMFLKELMLIKKAHQKSVMSVTISIFEIVVSTKCMQ